MSKRKALLSFGTVLAGTFLVGKPFAGGGYSIVYGGFNKLTGDPVVIKVLRAKSQLQDPAAIDRFIREGQVATQIRHPNVVRTFYSGQTPDGILFIVMENLVGRPLDQILYDKPMSPFHAQRILSQLLSGLDAVHLMGIVHRDIKPGNVFLCEEEGRRSPEGLDSTKVKLLDFGFAKVEESISFAGGISRPLTLDGHRVGTPGYMAPELLMGGELSPQADLYAVGVLGYEMLTGRKAFPGTGMQRAIAQLNTTPKLPSEKLQTHPLYRTVSRLMDPDPIQRYRSAFAALHDLSRSILVEDIELMGMEASEDVGFLDFDREEGDEMIYNISVEADAFVEEDLGELWDDLNTFDAEEELRFDEEIEIFDEDDFDHNFTPEGPIDIIKLEEFFLEGAPLGLDSGEFFKDPLLLGSGIEVVDELHIGDFEPEE